MLILWILIGFGFLFILQREIYVKCWNKKLSVTFRFSERFVTEGESVDLIERSENRKILPLPIFGYRYTLNRSFTSLSKEDGKIITLQRKLAIPGKRAVINHAKIEGLVRGVYSIDNVSIDSKDLFHVTEMNCSPRFGNSRLVVYPAKVPVEKILPSARLLLGTVITRRMAQEDPFALKSIRPYEIYDSPRIINWKASAKTGELKVNQFEYTTDESLVFLLDMSDGGIDTREELIRVASSLSLFFLRRGVSVSMLANCRDCISGRPIRIKAGADITHQKTVDENLALIKLTMPETAPFPYFLSGIRREAVNGALPVVISADKTGASQKAFFNSSEIRDGFFLFIKEKGNIKTEIDLTLISRGTADMEVCL